MNQPNDLVSAALVAAQGELQAATFDSQNPFLKNKYASLGAIIAESRPVLAKNGLAVLQVPTTHENNVLVATTILHKSGQWLDCGVLSLPMGEERGKSLAQVAGSLVTYLRRYAWASVLGMYAEEDTDGNHPPSQPKAIAKEQKPPSEAPKAPTPPPNSRPAAKPTEAKATAKYRLQALNKLQAAPGGRNRVLFTHFAMSKQWIRADQQPEEWPLDFVPATGEQFAKLIEEIQAFEMAQQPEIVP